jgi:hypothetical protein
MSTFLDLKSPSTGCASLCPLLNHRRGKQVTSECVTFADAEHLEFNPCVSRDPLPSLARALRASPLEGTFGERVVVVEA